MRLLDKDNIKVGVRQLGLSARDYRTFNNLIRRLTGSSWSPGQPDLEKLLLYAALNALNRPDRRLSLLKIPWSTTFLESTKSKFVTRLVWILP